MKRTLTLLLMAAITYSLSAQIDLHSHAVTDSYLAFIKEHHAEVVWRITNPPQRGTMPK